MNAVFFLCQSVGKLMLEQGSDKIINVASLLSFQGGLTVPAYAASKGAVLQFTKSLSNEWAYLASRESDYVNGSVLVVDGGWLGR